MSAPQPPSRAEAVAQLAGRIVASHEEHAATALVHSWDVARLRIDEAGGLVGRSEIATMWGTTASNVGQLARRHTDFPRPVGEPSGRPVYLREEVNQWRRMRGPRS